MANSWNDEMDWRNTEPGPGDPGWHIYGMNNAPSGVMEERGNDLREDLSFAREAMARFEEEYQ